MQIELVHVPAEPPDHGCPLSQDVLAVADQEADPAFGAIETSDGQIGFPQGGTCDRESVFGVGLAECAGTVPDMGHQLRRQLHDLLAASRSLSSRLLRCLQSSIAQNRS